MALPPNLEALVNNPSRELCTVRGTHEVRPTGRLEVNRALTIVMAEVTGFDHNGDPVRGWVPEHWLEVRT